MMKRILLFLQIAISLIVTSCENMQVDADAAPITLEIFVKDAEGNNLLDYDWPLDTRTDISTVLWKGNLWYPVLDGNYFYYLDVEHDYRLCRYDRTNDVVEILTHDRVDCFNIGGGYIYYQCNSATEPALKRMKLNGSDVTVIAEGNYTAIHITSQYVYFQEVGDDSFWYHSLIGSDTYSSM